MNKPKLIIQRDTIVKNGSIDITESFGFYKLPGMCYCFEDKEGKFFGLLYNGEETDRMKSKWDVWRAINEFCKYASVIGPEVRDLKIFEFDSGEIEWVAAESKEAAIACIKIDSGEDFGESEYNTIKELPKSRWAKMTIVDADEPELKTTFEEYMKRYPKRGMIATTYL